MFVLILSLVSTQLNIEVARDSALQQIQEGSWTQALEYAEIVITGDPDEYLLLGFLHFAQIMDYMPNLNPRIEEAINANRTKIYKAWEVFSILHKNNLNILNVLMVLYSSEYRTGAYKYARKVLELDSLSGLAHHILGHSAENDADYSRALDHYQRAIQLDTTLNAAYSNIATIYLLQNEYDSSLMYYSKTPYGDVLSNSQHIGKVICKVAKGNIDGAQAIVDQLRELETTWFVEASLKSLTKYIRDHRADRLAETDSFVIFGPFIGKRKPLQPTQWLAILTKNTIEILTEFQIKKPAPISPPPPTYPRSARSEGIEGQVVVLAFIDVDGNVEDVEIESTSGCLALDEAALECVRKWKFKQPRILGIHVPIQAVISIPINFRLVQGW